MKNLFQNKKLKTICLASLLGFSCIGLVISTVCWFTAARVTDESNDFVITNGQEISIYYNVYRYNADSKHGEELGRDNPLRYCLDEYDSFIISRNEHINRILRIEVNYYVPVDNKNLNVTISCSGDFKTDNKVNKIMSNIIQFRMMNAYWVDEEGTITYVDASDDPEADNYLDETSITTRYATSVKALNNVSDTYTFIDTSSYVKANSIEYVSAILPPTAVKSVFYLEYNYSDELINYFFDHSDYSRDSGEIDTSNAIQFDSDLEYIWFDFGA